MGADVDVLEVRIKTGTVETKRVVYRVAIGKTREDGWERLTQLREQLRGQEVVTMHHMRVIPVDTFGRMLEVIFRGEAKVKTTQYDRKGPKRKER